MAKLSEEEYGKGTLNCARYNGGDHLHSRESRHYTHPRGESTVVCRVDSTVNPQSLQVCSLYTNFMTGSCGGYRTEDTIWIQKNVYWNSRGHSTLMMHNRDNLTLLIIKMTKPNRLLCSTKMEENILQHLH